MAPRFEGYVEPRVTVNPEPRAEAQVEERGRMPAESEARVTWTSTTTTTAVDDRRQRARAKVNYFACVLSETFGKDVVTCIDMSRGGLGFRTKNAYAISAEVTVAGVVNIPELPELKMFRCGVAFLPVAGTRAHS